MPLKFLTRVHARIHQRDSLSQRCDLRLAGTRPTCCRYGCALRRQGATTTPSSSKKSSHARLLGQTNFSNSSSANSQRNPLARLEFVIVARAPLWRAKLQAPLLHFFASVHTRGRGFCTINEARGREGTRCCCRSATRFIRLVFPKRALPFSKSFSRERERERGGEGGTETRIALATGCGGIIERN